MDIQSPKTEYGGYLPLELPQGKEYFQLSGQDIRRYNCGRTSIYEAVRAMDIQKVWVPYYICNTAVSAIEQAGVEVARYFLNDNLEPKTELEVDNHSGVLAVNYFGIKDSFMREISQKFSHMILDCTQAFFSPPIMKAGICSIYSCRKFLGVPDGAYLIEKNTHAQQLREGYSWEYYSFLCKAHELGTNAAYRDCLENEKRLGERKEGMSQFTRLFLQGIDYHYIAEKRKENYLKVNKLLDNINQFHFQNCDGTPLYYPLWVSKNIGPKLKQKLLEKHIYIPTLWKECREMCDHKSLEVEWTNNLLCLPVDQRYSALDMEALAATIKTLVEEVKP